MQEILAHTLSRWWFFSFILQNHETMKSRNHIVFDTIHTYQANIVCIVPYWNKASDWSFYPLFHLSIFVILSSCPPNLSPISTKSDPNAWSKYSSYLSPWASILGSMLHYSNSPTQWAPILPQLVSWFFKPVPSLLFPVFLSSVPFASSKHRNSAILFWYSATITSTLFHVQTPRSMYLNSHYFLPSYSNFLTLKMQTVIHTSSYFHL